MKTDHTKYIHIYVHIFVANCNESYAAGGVAVFVSQKLIGYDIKKISLESADCINVSCGISGVRYCFVCVYRLHKCTVNVFLDEFLGFLESLTCKNIILIGDFNINILADSVDADNFLSFLSSFGFKSLLYQPTRLDSCLDHIFIRLHRNNNVNYKTEAYDLNITDHKLTSIQIDHCVIRKRLFEVKNFNKINFEALKEQLNFEFWVDVYNSEDPSFAFDLFINKLQFYITRCSRSNCKIDNKLKCLKQWMTIPLLKKIKKKNQICLQVKNHPNNTRLKNYYKKLCSELKTEIPLRRDTYFSNKLANNIGNSKKEWEVVNEILNRSKPLADIAINNNCTTTSDPLEVANLFNDFFANINCFQDIPESDSFCQYDANLHQEYYQLNSFFFDEFSALEIHKLITSLKTSNSSSIDQVSSFVLKNISLQISDVLCYIFNVCVRKGIFPESLKTAVIIPLHKKDDPTVLNNYRPISLLSVFSKVFERGIKSRVVSYLDRINFFSSSQFGFRCGKSTESALLKLTGELYLNLNASEIPAALFIDIAKAFDTVDHSLLLSKLFNVGFRGCIYNWFVSYLNNRKQVVRIKNNFSIPKIINIGVPQGSVLGPILFLIYINSLFIQPFKGNITAFADDAALSYANTSYLNLSFDINYDLDILRRWFKAHKLVISRKTKFMIFNIKGTICDGFPLYYHSPNCLRFPLAVGRHDPITFHDNISCNNACFLIERVDNLRYLGIIMDHKLSWKNHAIYLKQYLNKVVRQFYHLSQYCSMSVLKLVYNGLLKSKLQYGISCWGGTYSNTISPLIIKQKHAIRIMCKASRRAPSIELFRSLGILPLRHLYCYKVLKIFFDNSGFYDVRFDVNYNLRVNGRYFVTAPAIHKTHFSRFYFVTAPRLFNLLPENLRCERVKRVFLSGIKKWLFSFNLSAIEAFFIPVV